MKPARRTTLVLAVLAAASLALALREDPVLGAPDRARPARGELLPYPGAESLVARRVVADANPHYAPSPDGTRLSHQGSDGDLAMLDLHTGESRFLTGDSTVRGRPLGAVPLVAGSRFSPGGERIAYEWASYEEGVGYVRAIRILDLESGQTRELRHLPDTGGILRLGSWSPDGERIAALVLHGSRRADPGHIQLVDVRDGSNTAVASFQNRAAPNAVFSADGRWLAHHRPREESDDHDIFLLSVDGSVELPLTRAPGNYLVAGWLPGDGPFFYLSGDRGRFDLLAVDLEAGRAVSRPRVVRSDLWHVSPLGFSRDAFFYLQTTQRIQAHTARIDLEAGRLTEPMRPLFPASAAPRSAVVGWSPGGDRMAYHEGDDLVVRSLGTGAERKIPTGCRGVGAMEWSPVTDSILVQCRERRDGTRGVFLVSLADGSIELVAPRGTIAGGGQPRWSVDGRALFVGRWRDGALHQILLLDLETREEKVIFTAEPESWRGLTGFALHPSGRWLAVGRSGLASGLDDRVFLIPTEGGEPRELIRVDAPEGISWASDGLEWTADGRHLIIAGNPDAERRTRRLWVVDVDGTELRELGSFISARTPRVWSVRPRLHAGGREISVIGGENRTEVWTLEGLRPERPGGAGAKP